MNVTFLADRPFAVESPINIIEGSSITFTCSFWNTPSNVSAKVYRNGQDLSSTVMPSGSVTISGYTATLKPATAMVGVNRYVIAVTATVGGDTIVRKIELVVSKDEVGQ